MSTMTPPRSAPAYHDDFDRTSAGFRTIPNTLNPRDLARKCTLPSASCPRTFRIAPSTLNSTRTVGFDRTNASLIMPTIMQTDATTPSAGFDRAATPSHNPCAVIHSGPACAPLRPGSLDSGPASASSPTGSKCRMRRDGCGWCGPSVTPVTSRPAFRTRIGTAHGEGLQKDQRLAGMWQRRTFLHGYLTRLPRACWHRNDPNPTRRGIPRLRRRSRCACCLVLSPNLQSKPSVQTFGPNLRSKPSAQTFRADAAELVLRPRSSDRGAT